ncbi:MAG: enoyl-CoA hydratase/isomerase family protein [Deltaproteobacteria bacterium]|nr:MAG: enoyl-CoA hydratase/isomerase family protein [Deltaproteobacteria bacterium]
MGYINIIYKENGSVARIVLNRPGKHNALSNDLVDEMHRALDEAESNDAIKVVVFSGAGPSFCSGHDLSEVAFQYGWKEPKPGEKPKRPSQRVRLGFDRKNLCERLRRIFLFPKITIAQVHGNCVGEGFYTVSLCDLAIAAKNAKLARLEQRLGFGGMGPDFPILVMTIGLKRTMEILLTGRPLSGEEAEAIGFVNKAVPEEDLEQEVEKLAENLSLFSADGIAIAKAERHLNFEAMGMTAGFAHDYVTHTLATNFKLEPGEYNFLKERRDKGVTAAIHKRDGLFEKKPQE